MFSIPFAVETATGRIVEPEEVARGRACGCHCGHCGAPLVSRQGAKRMPHFAHDKDSHSPGGCGETAVHLMAKQLICERKEIWLPSYSLRSERYGMAVRRPGMRRRLVTCAEEVNLGAYRPDIVATLLDGRELCIEIAVTHFCDEAKRKWFVDEKRMAVEITLPAMCSKADIEARLFDEPPPERPSLNPAEPYAEMLYVELTDTDRTALQQAEDDYDRRQAWDRAERERKQRDQATQAAERERKQRDQAAERERKKREKDAYWEKRRRIEALEEAAAKQRAAQQLIESGHNVSDAALAAARLNWERCHAVAAHYKAQAQATPEPMPAPAPAPAPTPAPQPKPVPQPAPIPQPKPVPIKPQDTLLPQDYSRCYVNHADPEIEQLKRLGATPAMLQALVKKKPSLRQR